MKSYYIKENNFYIENTIKDIDVVFIGHFENDGRDEIKLYGKNLSILKIIPTYGEDYNLN